MAQARPWRTFCIRVICFNVRYPGLTAKSFLSGQKNTDETKLRAKNQHLLLSIDGYGSHVQFRTLQLFKESNIVVIALPSHTSYVLQPLDVTVFGPYKSYIQQTMHSAALQKKILNAFDIGEFISHAYCRAVIGPNMESGFVKTGRWNPECLSAYFNALCSLFEGNRAEGDDGQVELQALLRSFARGGGSLLRDA